MYVLILKLCYDLLFDYKIAIFIYYSFLEMCYSRFFNFAVFLLYESCKGENDVYGYH